MWYFVEYNGKLLKATKTKRAALSFILQKGFRDDAANVLRLIDAKGYEYEPLTGAPIIFEPL